MPTAKELIEAVIEGETLSEDVKKFHAGAKSIISKYKGKKVGSGTGQLMYVTNDPTDKKKGMALLKDLKAFAKGYAKSQDDLEEPPYIDADFRDEDGEYVVTINFE